MDPEVLSTPAAEQAIEPLNALTEWRREMTAGIAAAPLSVVRLDANERLLIPFTTGIRRCKLHFTDYPSLRGYTHCNENGCSLCRIGRQAEERDLLPMYDPQEKAVAVLAISPSLRPNALRPQLKPILERLQADSRILIGIQKPDNTRFVVKAYPLPTAADDGADVILRFLEQFDAGRIDLGSVFPRLTNNQLTVVPEIADAMKLRGITLS